MNVILSRTKGGEGMRQLREQIKDCKRIVIKVGSSSLTYKNGEMNLNNMDQLARQLVDLSNQGKEIILVSSGAIAAGMSYLKCQRPKELPETQAVASVGQAVLMQLYRRCFTDYNQRIGQVLLTKDIIDHKHRCENAKNTMEALIQMKVIPIVNENDTVATDEIEFGDNDTLSAIVACLVKADLLILLSDIDGLYEENPQVNPQAKMIEEVTEINDAIWDIAGGPGSKVGTGGMVTKIRAGKLAMDHGIHMVIANAKDMHIIHDIAAGNKVGTIFIP